LEIREDDLTGPEIAHLLQEHLDNMYETTPPESVHALDIAALRSPDITVWTAWNRHELLGCGALKALTPRSGEVKSMRTVTAHLRRGVASRILAVILAEARRRTYDALYLETGLTPEFAPARALYTRHGFEPCDPFGDYINDPNSVFMVKTLHYTTVRSFTETATE